MSLFRRVTRYRISPTQDPRENRLTEVTAAVLERVDGLAREVAETVLKSACDASYAQVAAMTGEAEVAAGEDAHDALAARLRALRRLDRPRVRVDTQVTTSSTKFVDLKLRFAPQPFQAGESLVFWVEVKHGAGVHGTQLDDYERDIAFTDADHRLVVVLAPRQSLDELVDVPESMPVVSWQAVAEVVRRWAKHRDLGSVERFLLNDYLAFLREEGLMDEELLTAEHAFALRAAPAAVSTTAKLMELADDYIAKHWGPRGQNKGGKNPAYGPEYWAHYELAPRDGEPPPATWRSSTFEWGLFGDQDREEPRNAFVFFAGATFFAARDDPSKVAENAEWLTARRQDRYEYFNSWFWRLFRFRYPEELLAATTLDEQVERLGSWVVESFQLLADYPPPH